MYSHLATLLVLVVLASIFLPPLSVPPGAALALIGAGLVNFIAFIFLYRAFHRGVVSVVAPVAYTYPAVTVVLSVLVLGAVLAPERIIAIVAIILGVVLLSTRFSELRAYLRGSGAPSLTAGVRSAVGSSFFFGLVYIGVGYAASQVNYILPAVFLRAVGVAAGFLLAPILRQDVKPSKSVFSTTIFVMGVLEAAGFVIFTYGISLGGGSLPVIAALSGMGGAVAASYALFFLRERLEPNQALGVLLSLAGVFTLLFLGG